MSVGIILGESASNEPELVNLNRQNMTIHFTTRDIQVPVIPPNADKPLPTMVAYLCAVAATVKVACPEKFADGTYRRLYREVLYTADAVI